MLTYFCLKAEKSDLTDICILLCKGLHGQRKKSHFCENILPFPAIVCNAVFILKFAGLLVNQGV